MANSVWAQSPNVVVGSESGADFAAVKGFLNGNTAVVNNSFTQSEMVTFSGDTTLTIQSADGTLKTITAGTGMTSGKGAFFSQTSETGTLTLNLSDVKFTGGKGATRIGSRLGGAIYSYGNLTFEGTNATFDKNSVTAENAAAAGGAICAENTATISGTNTFTNNTVTATAEGGTGNIYALGGAISAQNTITISGTNTFTNNTVTATAEGGTGNIYALGGAISAQNTITISGTNTFTGNSATATDGSAYGGAIFVAGDVVFSGDGSEATFSGNKADDVNNDIRSNNVTIRDGGTYSFGGGIAANGTLAVGVENQASTPDVTFGDGSITKVTTGLEVRYGSELTLESGSTFEAGSLVVSEEGSTLSIGNYVTLSSTGNLTVSDGGTIKLNIADTTFTPGKVAENLEFSDTSTLVLNFADTMAVAAGTEVLLFTAAGTIEDKSTLEYSQWLTDAGFVVDVLTKNGGLYARISGPGGNVPEPATWAMILVGLVGLGLYARRKKAGA
ncbi:MAG: PEP-CTERM sorting domain-containing protein [Planctomycetia bacterium]|nr:PEP-CTERM sorting domain-containing protein [Planctomycetia bacterium]